MWDVSQLSLFWAGNLHFNINNNKNWLQGYGYLLPLEVQNLNGTTIKVKSFPTHKKIESNWEPPCFEVR